MKNKNIKILSTKLSGVNNPILVINGKKNTKNIKFNVYEGKKKIDYIDDMSFSKNEFLLNILLSQKSSVVKVYYVDKDGHEELIYKCFNNKIKRLLLKIFSKMENFFNIFSATGKFIKVLWKKYRFMIPKSSLRLELMDLKDEIRNRNFKNFYSPKNLVDYNKWIEKKEEKTEFKKLKYNPLISVLIPIYNINRNLLSKCLDSIINGYYQNFEICLVDDCSTNKETIDTLKEYEEKDKRIKVKFRKENGHISRATNDALSMATGEFVALVDDDDELTKDALYCVAKALNKNKSLDFIYSDEDKLDYKGNRCDPNFKPDYSPHTLLSLNYICHLAVIRRKIVEEVGGFEVGLEGSQDHDLFLKVVEKTDNIYHIPKILYHWRIVKGSTSQTLTNKEYAIESGRKAVENALKRRKKDGEVVVSEKCLHYVVNYNVKKEPLVSIIIPTKDYADITEKCLESIYKKTTYKNYEIILMNNNSSKQETFDLFDKYKKKYKNFKVIDANYEFNYSRINNDAVKNAKGDYVCLLNNDTEIISGDWLTNMVGYAMQPEIGAVGAKLLYPDDTVQHGGIILGLGGTAGHIGVNLPKDDLLNFGRLLVPFDCSAVTAACLLVSKKKYLEVNGLDEKLTVAFNDVDFNMKLLDKGYYNICIPQVTLYHYESKTRGYDTTSEKHKRFLKEKEYMYKKWNDKLLNDKFYNKNLSKNIPFNLDK